MLDSRDVELIKKVLDEEMPEMNVEIEDVYRLTPINISIKARGLTIYALQQRDVTILVWFQHTKIGPVVRRARKLDW